MTQKSVNVLSVVNKKSKISTQIINNKEHIVINDVVPIVDDVVMNGIFYPADEINKSYMSLNNNLMPVGHPKVNNEHVSALNPEAINDYYVGAWGRNARKSGDKVMIDAYIDRKFAESTDKGKLLVNRLDQMMNGEDTTPIHVSTGLVFQPDNQSGVSKGKKYGSIARNMQFDHVAILTDEQGAATPDDGVGIFVNSQGDKLPVEQVSLIDATNFTQDGLLNKVKFFFANSEMSFDQIHSLISAKLNVDKDKWSYIEAVYPSYFIYESDRKQFKQQYHVDKSQITFIGDAVEVVKKVDYDEIKTNGENQEMKKVILQALNSAGVKTEGLTDEQLLKAYNEKLSQDAIDKKKAEEEEEAKKKKEKETATNSEVPNWAKELTEKVTKLETAVNANADKELSVKRQAVKDKFGMSEIAVNSLAGEALNEMYAQCIGSTSLNGSFANNSNKDTLMNMEAPE